MHPYELDPEYDELLRQANVSLDKGLAAMRKEMPGKPWLLRSERWDAWRLRRAALRTAERHRPFFQDTTWRSYREARRVDEETVEHIWGSALARLYGLFTLLELIAHDAVLHQPEASEEHHPRLRVAIDLFGRSMLVASEVQALIERAFPHGAMARWRSLYELAVVMTVASQDAETARRYLEHSFLDGEREVRSIAETTQRFGGREPSPYVQAFLAEAAERRQALEQRYGKAFSRQYGWAAHLTERALNNPHPTFSTLERLVNSRGWLMTPLLQTAHHHVHAAMSGSVFLWHEPQHRNVVSPVPTPHALGTPGKMLAETLSYVGCHLLGLFQQFVPSRRRRWRFYEALVLQVGAETYVDFEKTARLQRVDRPPDA